MDHSIVLKSYGKINLGLDVLRRREDGYHEVRMILQTVGLYDVLTMKKRKDDKIEMTCNLSFLPTDERNLVYKAVKLIKDKYHIKDGVEINLSKRIPVAAGMAGGSSNCAAALKGMNQLFDLGLSIDELCEIGVTLGADVPYCIWGGTALSEGIGEKLSRVDAMPDCYILIAKPGISVSTKYVYTTHSELNAILNYRGGSLEGAKLYVTLFPCNECAKAIIQAGIKTVVYDQDKYCDTPAVIASKRMMDAAGVRYYRYQHTGRKIEFAV